MRLCTACTAADLTEGACQQPLRAALAAMSKSIILVAKCKGSSNTPAQLRCPPKNSQGQLHKLCMVNWNHKLRKRAILMHCLGDLTPLH